METLTHDLAKPDTLRDLVQTWQQAQADIREADALLKRAKANLTAMYSGEKLHDTRFEVKLETGHWRNSRKVTGVDGIVLELQREVWRVLVTRMEIRPRMSVAAAKKLDEQLDADTLPEVTEENILGMMEAAFANLGNFMNEAVQEVFDFLRPPGSHYKTNTEFELGKRCILSWYVEQKWNGGGYRVNYQRAQQLRALDNVFHLMDGQGVIKTYGGPLHDAIEAVDSGGYGETDYFKFRCCKNRSLHLEFKRLDLVKKLNEIAGGNRMKPAQTP